jgi:hypothetical protein
LRAYQYVYSLAAPEPAPHTQPTGSYGVRPPTPDGAPGQIWVVDVFQHALEAPASRSAAPLQRLHGVALRQVVATSPPLDFHVAAAAASANGHQLLLSGTSIEVCLIVLLCTPHL